MGKVSVIVPIYNAGNKLNKCIKSILSQTFSDLELILVNDGSTDNSLSICRKFASQDRRISIVDKQNEGSIKARKSGMEAASTNYIMFVDADDWLDKHIVEMMYKEAIENNLDVTICNMYRVLGSFGLIKQKKDNSYFKNGKIHDESSIKNELVVSYLHGHTFPSSLCAKLYKRELLLSCGVYLEKIRFFGDDLYLNLEIFLKSHRVKLIDKPLYYYRTGGTTSKYMSYLFHDMVNGYEIQKEVILQYYQESQHRQHFNGISIMLLNTFKTCLYNLINGGIQEFQAKQLIREYTSNESVKECLSNEGSKKLFPGEFLKAIKEQDVDYLYQLGLSIYRERRYKKMIVNMLSKVSVI